MTRACYGFKITGPLRLRRPLSRVSNLRTSLVSHLLLMFVNQVGLPAVVFSALSALVAGAVGKVPLNVPLQICLVVVFFPANTALKPLDLLVDVHEVACDVGLLLRIFIASRFRALELAIDFRNFRDLDVPEHTKGIRYFGTSKNFF
jgi:hypothetical protein